MDAFLSLKVLQITQYVRVLPSSGPRRRIFTDNFMADAVCYSATTMPQSATLQLARKIRAFVTQNNRSFFSATWLPFTFRRWTGNMRRHGITNRKRDLHGTVRRLMKFDATLWDLDGTLVDSLEDIAAAMNQVLQRLGLPPHDLESYREFVGEGVEVLADRALPESHRDVETRRRAVTDWRKVYGNNLLNKTKPYAGIAGVLNLMHLRGLSLSVLSNKPDAPTRKIVSACFTDHAFLKVVGAKPDVPKKPDPAAALAIARELGVAPEKFIYFGDTAIDMKTAVSAGMFPVGVLWGFRGPEELLPAGARILVKSPADLLAWLGGL
jgi:phosphoglycolate phosphatase